MQLFPVRHEGSRIKAGFRLGRLITVWSATQQRNRRLPVRSSLRRPVSVGRAAEGVLMRLAWQSSL